MLGSPTLNSVIPCRFHVHLQPNNGLWVAHNSKGAGYVHHGADMEVRIAPLLALHPRLDVTTKRNYNKAAMELEWDTGKAARNLRKHGVSFEDAELVFLRRLPN